MTETTPANWENGEAMAERGMLHRVHFVPEASKQPSVMMQFANPRAQKAVLSSSPVHDEWPGPTVQEHDGIEILAIACPPADHPELREEMSAWVSQAKSSDMTPAIGVVTHGVQVFWRPGIAALMAAPDRMDAILRVLVEFSYYENELRKLEVEVGAAWRELEADASLAGDVTMSALERRDKISGRMEQAIERRMRHARIQPHLARASTCFTLQAQELGQRLREKCKLEDRHETLDGQLAAFERVYEMTSQRISDFRSSRDERKLEWIIIVLLAAEVLLLLADLLWRLESPAQH